MVGFRTTFALLALQAGSMLSMAAPQQEFVRCGVDTVPTHIMQAASQMEASKGARPQATGVTQITVNTHFHVVTTAAKQGTITQKMLNDQAAVLNKSYNPYGISFVLASSDFTVNDNWATGNFDSQMKPALRKGTYAELNVYFLSDLGNGLLGICNFPASAPPGSSTFNQDGCDVLAQSVPGGNVANYNLGGSATHEIGHWFGLFHPFQGSSCSGPGDQIADTPQQKSPTSGCPASSDTCPNVPGLDSIHNYMDYSYDICYNQFTADQKIRMFNMYAMYRAGK